jgi:segregation and condensation protein B
MGSDMARGRTHSDAAELEDLPRELRWREYMGRVEAVLFAAPQPVTREMLARVVGHDISIEAVIADISEELRGRPYEIALVAGGWRMQTRAQFAGAIRDAAGVPNALPLTKLQSLALTAIAYFQPLTRSELSQIIGREIGRDLIVKLRDTGLVGTGPRSPRAGAPNTLVTTPKFLEQFGFASLRELPDMERLEDEGLLTKEALLSGELARAFGVWSPEDEPAAADETVPDPEPL